MERSFEMTPLREIIVKFLDKIIFTISINNVSIKH